MVSDPALPHVNKAVNGEWTVDPVALTAALVACPSVTPDAGEALDLAEAFCRTHGLVTERLVFGSGADRVDNLFAQVDFGDADSISTRPHVAFAGHLDVVPTGDPNAWAHGPFSGAMDGGYLHGRGATDMKSGVAAFMAAVANFLQASAKGSPGRISFIITGDEEGPAINGTVRMLDWMCKNGHTPDHCIVAEPSSLDICGDQIKVGRRGSVSGTLTAHGLQGHVAYPEKALNPIPRLAAMIAAITDAPLDGGVSRGNNRFQPSHLEFTTIATGNSANNVIPGAATARFNIRYNVSQTPDALKAELERRAASVAGADAFSISLDPNPSEPFLTEDAYLLDLAKAAIFHVTGATPDTSTGGGTSDARFIKTLCPVLELGLPGKTMHAVDERVAIDDIRTLTRIFEAFLARYFPNPSG
ncbi:MAG: succinyl-diaminopimelate desuccinylase [Pseudomonadota bacterium]